MRSHEGQSRNPSTSVVNEPTKVKSPKIRNRLLFSTGAAMLACDVLLTGATAASCGDKASTVGRDTGHAAKIVGKIGVGAGEIGGSILKNAGKGIIGCRADSSGAPCYNTKDHQSSSNGKGNVAQLRSELNAAGYDDSQTQIIDSASATIVDLLAICDSSYSIAVGLDSQGNESWKVTGKLFGHSPFKDPYKGGTVYSDPGITAADLAKAEC